MKVKVRRDEMVISRFNYEQMVRDQGKLEILEACIIGKAQTPDEFYRCILGRQLEIQTGAFPCSLADMSKNPAIMIENIEDPTEEESK